MTWHVQYCCGGTEYVERHPTPEQAIEAACRLLDARHDVHGIGTGELTDSIGKPEIARIYDLWQKAAGSRERRTA